MSTTAPQPGDKIHFLGAMTLGTGDAVQRGQTVEITSELIEGSKDRLGRSWLDLVDDDDAQVRRWGQVTFRRGACPEDVMSWNGEDGAGMRGLLRSQELEEARTISNPRERREKIAEVNAKYGPAPTSWTLASYGPDGDQKFGPSARS